MTGCLGSIDCSGTISILNCCGTADSEDDGLLC